MAEKPSFPSLVHHLSVDPTQSLVHDIIISNFSLFAVVLKAVLALQFYRKVFAVVRVSALHMLSPLLTFVLVKILTIVGVVTVRARV